MTEARCKMSIYIEELEDEANVCAMYLNVKCEGLRNDSRCCPFWKGASEP